MFLLFLYLSIGPLYAPIPKSHDTIFSNLTLLSQFAFWGIWYGFTLLSVIFVGRLWCGLLCPLGALSEWVGKFGLKKATPSWVKWNGWLVIMFVVVTILGQTMDVRDDPKGLALLFLYIFALAALIGFVFGKKGSRPWCRYFCPIGKILGVVSRIGMLDFRPNKQRTNADKLPEYIESGLCPTDYNLSIKSSTLNCIACGKCVHAKPKAMLGLYLRKPGEEVKQIKSRGANWSEILFILLAPGLAAGGFLWTILNNYTDYRNAVGGYFLDNNMLSWFNHASQLVSSQTWNQHYSWLDVTTITTYMLFYGVVIALFLSLSNSVVAKLLTYNRADFIDCFKGLAYQFIPIAILSIIIGLCGKFFQVLNSDFHVPNNVDVWIKAIMLLASMIWSLILSYQFIKNYKEVSVATKFIAYLIIILNVGVLLYLWWPAILGQGPMSEVEMIRKHLIVPS
nr:4Fe-4S binding protein [Vibrio sinus]